MSATAYPLTRIEQIAYTETYQDVHLLLCKIVHNFVRCYGLPFDELMGEANFAFARACARHRKPANRHKRFSTMVYFMATCRLKTYVKKLNKHRNHLEVNEEICGTTDHPQGFLEALRGELTADARDVVSLVVDSNDDMQMLLRLRRGRTPHAVREALKEHLLDLGWDRERIDETFHELFEIFRG